MDTNWLSDLASNSLGDFDVTEGLDIELSALAIRARYDEDIAWQLLERLAWKIVRFVRRFQYWDLDPFELDDVVQESYLVYRETLQRWRPRPVNGIATGYLYFFLKAFPHRLAEAVRRWRRPTRVPMIRERWNALATIEGSRVEDFCRNLAPEDATLLRLRLTRGLSVPLAAETMGLPRRTAYRRWHHILEMGREYLREAG